MSNLSYGILTDVGRVRRQNQDSCVALGRPEIDELVDGLFVVADGMGGRAGGEIASQVTVETIPEVVREQLRDANGANEGDALADAMREAIVAANDAVWQQARANPDLRGMGTTCVAAIIRDSTAVIGNVGDSRIYLLRGGNLRRLTADHSLVQEYVRAGDLSEEQARASRFRNVITRAIGAAATVQPDVEVMEMQDGDTLLLCSDGLTSMVEECEIARTLASEEDTQETCRKLVESANARGGEDNITALVIRHGAYAPALDIVVAGEEPAVERPRIPYQFAPPARQTISAGVFTLWLLVFALTGLVVYLGRDKYSFVPKWPFLAATSPPPAHAFPSLPPIDLTHMDYDPPRVLIAKPLRGAPIACDAAGNVYAMTESGKTVRVTPAGEIGGDFGAPVRGEQPSLDRNWAADSQGNLYVSSKTAKQIYKYNSVGTRTAIIGATQLESPEGVAVDASGNIFVVDNNRLKVLHAHSRKQTTSTPTTQRPNDPTTRQSLSVQETGHATR